MWPFKSQIPGSNPGRSITSSNATANVNQLHCDLPLHKVAIWDADHWEGFDAYLKQTYDNQRTQAMYLSYCKNRYEILLSGDLSKLLTMSDGQRRHTMKALTALSKFLGCYKNWHESIKEYGMTWASPDASLTAFQKITNDQENIDVMLQWFKKAITVLPKPYADTLTFMVYTGLRPSESLQAIKILKTATQEYLKDDVLLHYKYPKTFIRRTKKAYISLVTPEILNLANACPGFSYQAMCIKIRRSGLPVKMEYCRQIFGTYLVENGIQERIVDLLQGRIPPKVFLRHYYRPNFKKKIEKVRACLYKLNREIGA